jgi:hypothetical protein
MNKRAGDGDMAQVVRTSKKFLKLIKGVEVHPDKRYLNIIQ